MIQPNSGQASPSLLEAMQERLDFARKLQGLTNKIHATDNVSQMMLDLSVDICELFHCERFTLYVVDKERGVLISKVMTGIDANKELVLPIDRKSIAGYVALTRSAVRINDLDDPEELAIFDPDLRFYSEVDRITGFKSKQMLVAPLLQGPDKELVGVLQLINERVDGRFDRAAEEGLETLTSTLAQALSQRIKTAALLPKRYEVLAADGVISATELELAHRWSLRKNKDLEQVLAEDFEVPLAAIGNALAKQANLPYQALEASWRPDRKLAKKVTRQACLKHQWLPWASEQTFVTVVTTEPDNRQTTENIHLTLPYNEIRLCYTTRTEFNQMLERYFSTAA